MTSATSLAKSRRASAGHREAPAVRLLRSVSEFGALCASVIRLARDLEAAATDRERRQIAARAIGPRGAA